jgi:hypothetical protein
MSLIFVDSAILLLLLIFYTWPRLLRGWLLIGVRASLIGIYVFGPQFARGHHPSAYSVGAHGVYICE